jgi:hypothetical protein
MTRTLGQANIGAVLAILLGAFGGAAGCSRDTGNGGALNDSDIGNVEVALTLAPGITISTVGWTINGPNAFTRTGSIDVANSSTIAATIGGLPSGNGFTIALTANTTSGGAMCGGSTTFNVSAGMTGAVAVHLTCHQPPRSGSISVNGTINICPVVDGISANPAQVAVGSPVALSAAAHDSDGGPTSLSYTWTAATGTFASGTTATPTFTCNAPGPVTITVTASDGDLAAGCPATGSVQIRCRLPGAGGPATPSVLAAYGDAPYGTTPTDDAETLATPAFIANVNADPDVSLVIHVGDIHSGKQYCTQAYDETVFNLWTAYVDPLVYTPGDNEWTDCHKVAEGGGAYNATTMTIDYVKDTMGNPVDYASGDPIANLALVRSLFFPTAGQSLGTNKRQVLSQAQVLDAAHPGDAAYIENVMWEQSNVLFVAINLPGGSNNDQDVWYGAPTATAAQTQEAADRTGADLRWLDLAFAQAQADGVAAVAIIAQADMWDPEKGAAHQTGYEPFVMNVAAYATVFGKPVLMFNGDSHVYQTGNPMDPTDPGYSMHPGYNVPNFHRIVVHGSTTPLEWLKVTIDPSVNAPQGPNAFGPFAWTRMIQP